VFASKTGENQENLRPEGRSQELQIHNDLSTAVREAEEQTPMPISVKAVILSLEIMQFAISKFCDPHFMSPLVLMEAYLSYERSIN
jgi:hypothetical protein